MSTCLSAHELFARIAGSEVIAVAKPRGLRLGLRRPWLGLPRAVECECEGRPSSPPGRSAFGIVVNRCVGSAETLRPRGWWLRRHPQLWRRLITPLPFSVENRRALPLHRSTLAVTM